MNLKYDSVAISGTPGSGKSAIAFSLHNYFLEKNIDWPVSSIGELWRARHKQQRLDITFEEYWKNTSPDENMKVDAEFIGLVETGKVRIADVRYAHIYSDRTLKVFVDCDPEVKARRAFGSAKYVDKSFNEIKYILELREKDEVSKGKKIWGSEYDFRDRKYYQVHIDNSSQSVLKEVAITRARDRILEHLIG